MPSLSAAYSRAPFTRKTPLSCMKSMSCRRSSRVLAPAAVMRSMRRHTDVKTLSALPEPVSAVTEAVPVRGAAGLSESGLMPARPGKSDARRSKTRTAPVTSRFTQSAPVSSPRLLRIKSVVLRTGFPSCSKNQLGVMLGVSLGVRMSSLTKCRKPWPGLRPVTLSPAT